MRFTIRLAGAALTLCLAAQEVPLVQRSESDMLLLQPYLDTTPLGDGIEAYPLTGGGVLVPLGELCRLLAFGIRVEAAQGRAGGFFISEKRRFTLDLARGMVESEGRWTHLQPGTAERQARDIYVDAHLLAEWFPLLVEVDAKGSALLLKARERLPVQDTWERDRRFGNEGLRRYGEDPEGPVGRPTPIPYSFLDVPFADLSVSANRFSGQTRTQTSGTVSLAGDLLWMSAYAYASRDPDGQWRNARGTLFREDPRGGLLGPLHARRVALGDLSTTPTLELVGGLPQGRGLSLDNYPVAYRTRFATRTFRGSLPEGWAVEFFQNGGLVGFQRSRTDGLYEFTEVPLRFGLNEFKLVFHGPQGQEREERQRLDIAQEQAPPGTFYYSLVALRPTLAEASTTLTAATPKELQRPAYLASAEYGVTSWLAIQAGASQQQAADGTHTYGVLGVQGLFPYLALQLTGAQDQASDQPQERSPGQAAQAVLRTGLGYSSLTLRRAEYRGGFQRSAFAGGLLWGADQQIRSSSGVEINANGHLGHSPLTFLLSLDQETYTDDTVARRERAQVGFQVVGLNLGLALARVTSPLQPAAPLEGSLLASRFWLRFSFQGDLTYQRVAGVNQMKNWSTQGDYRTDSGLQFRLGFRGAGPGGGPPVALAGVTKAAGRFGFGLDYLRNRDTQSVALRLQVSLGREPRTGRFVTDALSMTNQGAVSAQAFLDANGNGRRDPGEEILEGTRFKAGESLPPSRLDDPRTTFLTQLPRGQEVDIALDASSLQDAAQQSTVKAYRIVPRPGKVARLDFPVSTFGEITGTTRIRKAGRTQELPGLEIELCKASGERIKVLRSAYDGYFEFHDLPHGEYLLRVTAEEVARVKLRAPEPRRFRIDDRRNLLDGLDLVVESAVEAPVMPPGPAPAPRPSDPAPPAPDPGLAAPPPAPTALARPQAPRVAPADDWTVVLVAAFEEATVEAARQELGPRAAEMFILERPAKRLGQRLRLVCFGRFGTPAEARRAIESLPPHFFLGGNHPHERHLASPVSPGSLP